MLSDHIMFNENNFIDFLIDTSAKPYRFHRSTEDGAKEVSLAKIVDPTGSYVVVLDITSMGISALGNLSPDEEKQFCGIFFKYDDYFVYTEDSIFSDLEEVCTEIKLCSQEKLFQQIYMEANAELTARYKELKDEEGLPVFEKLITKRKGKKGLPMGIYKFRKFKPYDIIQQYITNPVETVSNFIDKYVEFNKEFKAEKTARLGQMLYDNDTFKRARTAWVTLESGDRKKIKNEIKILENVVRIGTAADGVEIDDVVSIEYNTASIPLLTDKNIKGSQINEEVPFL